MILKANIEVKPRAQSKRMKSTQPIASNSHVRLENEHQLDGVRPDEGQMDVAEQFVEQEGETSTLSLGESRQQSESLSLDDFGAF